LNQVNKQEDRVALVTGGARRIGAALVKMIHAEGYKVVIHCRGALKEAHDLAIQLNQMKMDSAFVLERELTKAGSAEEIITTVIDWAGQLDLLVNNASVFIRTPFQSFTEEIWQELFDVNVKVPFLLSHAAYPYLKKVKGSIINISDIHAERPLKEYSVYCQSKAALEMQTRSLARELAPDVRVNAIAPGATIWPEGSNSLDIVQKQKIVDKTPLKIHGHPDYIAQAVVSLAGNPFITGQILKVDGGRSL
jgi:pteridine reductase